MVAAPPVTEGRKSWLDQVLSLVAEVRAGEGLTALLLAVTVFVLLAAYYVIRPVREALILPVTIPLAGKIITGAQIKSYTGGLFAALFIFIVPAYGAFASKVNRIRLINWVTLFFVSNLVIFFLVGRAGVPLAVPFFLWVGIFNLMVIAQFWSFANDLYTPEQGKRLFAIVGVGSSVGAVAGSTIAGALIKPLGLFGLMLVAAGMLLLCLTLTNAVHFRERRVTPSPARRLQAEQPLAPHGGFQLVMRHRYLLLIGLMTLMVQFVNTNGEYILGETVAQAARRAAAGGGGSAQGQIIGSFYANFQFYQNILGAAIQLFFVSRIFKYLGVGKALFIMPAISLCGYGLMAAAPVLAFIRVAKILENATDYSLQNTVRRALFLPTSREAKYKALQAVETFFWRAGDMLSAFSTFGLVALLGLGVNSYAAVNVALVAAWMLLAAGVSRENRKLTAEAPAEAA